MFRVTGLNILGRVGTHIFFKYFLFCNIKYNFKAFRLSKCIRLCGFFFPENLKKILGSPVNLRLGSGYPKHRYFFIWPKPAQMFSLARVHAACMTKVKGLLMYAKRVTLVFTHMKYMGDSFKVHKS